MIPQFNVRQALEEHARRAAAPIDDEFEERAAIIAEGCGVSQEEATKLARNGNTPPPNQITGERAELWLRTFDCFAGSSACDQKLLDASMRFVLSPWAYPAIASGWSDGELFSVPAGLIPQMAVQTLHLMAIAENGATLMNGRGIVATIDRHRFQSSDPPWWQRNQQ